MNCVLAIPVFIDAFGCDATGALGAVALSVALDRARRMTRLLESIALGTEVLDIAAASVSAALTGADSSIAQAVANAVKVASLGDLAGKLVERVDWLLAFIKIVTLIIRY